MSECMCSMHITSHITVIDQSQAAQPENALAVYFQLENLHRGRREGEGGGEEEP